jgi:hypothetical protein
MWLQLPGMKTALQGFRIQHAGRPALVEPSYDTKIPAQGQENRRRFWGIRAIPGEILSNRTSQTASRTGNSGGQPEFRPLGHFRKHHSRPSQGPRSS